MNFNIVVTTCPRLVKKIKFIYYRNHTLKFLTFQELFRTLTNKITVAVLFSSSSHSSEISFGQHMFFDSQTLEIFLRVFVFLPSDSPCCCVCMQWHGRGIFQQKDISGKYLKNKEEIQLYPIRKRQ